MIKKRRLFFKITFYSLFIVVFNSCATVIYKTIPLKNIAKTKGTYFVGTQNFQVIDSSRVMWFTDNIKGPRKLSVKIWYPVDNVDSFSKAPYLNQHKIIGSSISKLFGVPEPLMDRAGGVKCNSWLNAVPARGKFPIVIYSHGHQSIKIANTSQAEEMASNGYIVIAFDHTYDAALTVIDNDNIIYTRSKLPQNDDEAASEKMIKRVKNQLEIRTSDISFIIDKIELKFSNDKSFSDIADFNNIGIFGHSFGGCTAIKSAYNDNRIDAVLGLDAYFLPLSKDLIKKDLNKPFAHIGQVDWGTSNNYNIMEEFGKNNSKSSYHFSVEGSKHNDFTDFSQFTKLTRKFGSGEISPKIIRNVMNDIMIGFFDAHLKDSEDFDAGKYEDTFKSVKTYVH